jgi:hypothetical protein
VGDQLSLQLAPAKKTAYQPRGINVLQFLFKKHFQSFTDQYEDKYAIIYGRFRIQRIIEVVEKFVLCGDYSQGIVRIQCTNPDCKYEYFRPFHLPQALEAVFPPQPAAVCEGQPADLCHPPAVLRQSS